MLSSLRCEIQERVAHLILEPAPHRPSTLETVLLEELEATIARLERVPHLDLVMLRSVLAAAELDSALQAFCRELGEGSRASPQAHKRMFNGFYAASRAEAMRADRAIFRRSKEQGALIL